MSFFSYLFECDPSQNPCESDVFPHPHFGLSIFKVFICIGFYYYLVTTVKDISTRSSMNLSFNPSIHLLEPYFTLKSARSILNTSLLNVVLPSVVEIVAGIVIFFVTSLIVKFPVTAKRP